LIRPRPAAWQPAEHELPNTSQPRGFSDVIVASLGVVELTTAIGKREVKAASRSNDGFDYRC